MTFASLLHLFGGCNSSSSAGRKSNTETTSGRFKVGQIWKYHNREGEDSSTCTILKIETYDVTKDTIIHIRIDGVKIYSPDSPDGYSHAVGHLPCDAKAVSKSVTEMIGVKEPLPDFAEGYALWKKAWDEGKGGYFTIELKEVVESFDRGMKRGN
jgi:hypothetical protein